MGKYKLIEVVSRKDIRRFLDMTDAIYRGFDNWVRPLDNDIEAVFDPAKNKFFKGGEAIRWIAVDENNKVVGRIAAFYNQRTAAENEQPTGGCGFFECINDTEASALLFDAARDWLKSKSMEAMDGPINFGDRDQWWGVLVDGFTRPVYGMPYNLVYYKDLFEAYGFQNYFNQYTYLRDLRAETVNPLVVEKARRLRENPEYRFEHIRKKNLNQVVKDFRVIYNKAWTKFNGVAEMTEEQATKILNTLKPIIDERLIYFAYYKGEPIGFFIMIPDLNGIVRHLGGKMNLWGKVKFFYHLKIKKSCANILALIFAVTPEQQGKGIESGMIDLFKEVINSQPTKYRTMELSWMGDFNPLMIRMVENYVCATKYKTHTTYRYLFDREKEFKRAPRVSASRKQEAAAQ